MLTPIRFASVVIASILVKYFFDDVLRSTRRSIQIQRLRDIYDYIIVGGGTAGCVLAGRLSENPNVTVLLLESGPEDLDRAFIITPALAGLLWKTSLDWEYWTERSSITMSGLQNKRSLWTQGRVLGGSGSIGTMQYVRGSRHDYDRWAKYLGNAQWDYRHVLQYFKKSEDIQISNLKDSVYHGQGGELAVNHAYSQPLVHKLIEAGKSMGYMFNEDYNGKSMEGISRSQVNTRNNERWSTSHAYIHTALGRKNLYVSVNSHVTRLIMQYHIARGVIVVKNSRKVRILAKQEVILSAGAVGSPKILMNSGIGPREHLESLHIPVIANLPVGENLQDHVMADIGVKIEQPLSHSVKHVSDKWNELLYYTLRMGPLTSPLFLETVAFKTTRQDSKQTSWPDLQIQFMSLLETIFEYDTNVKNEMAQRQNADYGFICLPILLHPESRGRVTLQSNDPIDYPRIEPNYLEKQKDIDTLITGIQECEKFVNTKTLQDIGAELAEKVPISICNGHKFRSYDYWRCLIKSMPLTAYHPVGTCKMGPRGDPTAVVDADLRVHGICNLRVVDASIMPWIVSGDTNAATVMIAEVAADLIRSKTPLKPSNL
ncbi:alcohol dehydrogenase [acceptor] [Biomphalaria pfeifferi]|uniref:Alcohol dehydrogenase [acceptor] n=1 Tax=Biomphalaria pfeifferi TaxID=112525 RepID=A0AAD8AQG9_BIOPF|nr:alcohol dehydrogenase [acceptor] [Biomphalaria pfeifferi]